MARTKFFHLNGKEGTDSNFRRAAHIAVDIGIEGAHVFDRESFETRFLAKLSEEVKPLTPKISAFRMTGLHHLATVAYSSWLIIGP